MVLERIEKAVLDTLTSADLRVRASRIADHNDLIARRGDIGTRMLDEHRLSAYATIDQMMEREVDPITPEEAAQRKQDWDARHGY